MILYVGAESACTGQLGSSFCVSVEAVVPSFKVVIIGPHRFHENAPGGWGEGLAGNPVVFYISSEFLQRFDGRSSLEPIEPLLLP